MLEAKHQLLRLLLANHGECALADILAKIADPLEISGDAERRHDLAQVVSHRLPPRDHDNRLLLDLMLELINDFVLFDGDLGEIGVAALQGVDRLAHDLLGKASHFGDLGIERRKLFFIRSDDVLVLIHLGLLEGGAA